jgi:hypothetical protein
VHAPFRDHLAVEMGQLLDQPDILQQRWAARAGGTLSVTGAPDACVRSGVLVSSLIGLSVDQGTGKTLSVSDK